MESKRDHSTGGWGKFDIKVFKEVSSLLVSSFSDPAAHFPKKFSYKIIIKFEVWNFWHLDNVSSWQWAAINRFKLQNQKIFERLSAIKMKYFMAMRTSRIHPFLNQYHANLIPLPVNYQPTHDSIKHNVEWHFTDNDIIVHTWIIFLHI